MDEFGVGGDLYERARAIHQQILLTLYFRSVLSFLIRIRESASVKRWRTPESTSRVEDEVSFLQEARSFF